MAQIRNQHKELYQRETMPDKFVFFFQNSWWGKKVNRVNKIHVCRKEDLKELDVETLMRVKTFQIKTLSF